jgi:hypothetical protein
MQAETTQLSSTETLLTGSTLSTLEATLQDAPRRLYDMFYGL